MSREPDPNRLVARLVAELERHLGPGPCTASDLAAFLVAPDPPADLIAALEDVLVWAAARRRQRRLVYEGEVYLRPVGRGLILEGTATEGRLGLDLADWIESWLDHRTGYIGTNETGRLRISVEYLGEREARPAPPPEHRHR